MAHPAARGLPGQVRPAAVELPTMSMAVRPAAPDDDTVTIGVVIDLPDPWGTELRRWRRDFGDPMADAIPAHVTLLPPTTVAPGLTTLVEEHLGVVAAASRPFTVKLAGTDSFRPVSPVVFVALVEGVDGCDLLQKAIRTGPLDRGLDFPYHPHVTVAHHLDEPAMDRAQEALVDYHADFTVDGVELYEHGRDGVWRLRRRYAFGGA
jgi:2'-5' RNA ligase